MDMHAQIKLGRIFGIELGLHYSWLIIAALIAFSLAEHFRATDPNWSTLANPPSRVSPGRFPRRSVRWRAIRAPGRRG